MEDKRENKNGKGKEPEKPGSSIGNDDRELEALLQENNRFLEEFCRYKLVSPDENQSSEAETGGMDKFLSQILSGIEGGESSSSILHSELCSIIGDEGGPLYEDDPFRQEDTIIGYAWRELNRKIQEESGGEFDMYILRNKLSGHFEFKRYNNLQLRQDDPAFKSDPEMKKLKTLYENGMKDLKTLTASTAKKFRGGGHYEVGGD